MNVVNLQRKEKLLNLHEVEANTSLKKSTIYKLMGQGDFPRPIKLTPKKAVWVETDVLQWIDTRVNQSRSDERNRAELEAKRKEELELATLARLLSKYGPNAVA